MLLVIEINSNKMNSSIFVVCFLFAVAAALPLADVVPEVSGLEGLGEVVVEAANAAEAVRKARQIIDVDILLGGGKYWTISYL